MNNSIQIGCIYLQLKWYYKMVLLLRVFHNEVWGFITTLILLSITNSTVNSSINSWKLHYHEKSKSKKPWMQTLNFVIFANGQTLWKKLKISSNRKVFSPPNRNCSYWYCLKKENISQWKMSFFPKTENVSQRKMPFSWERKICLLILSCNRKCLPTENVFSLRTENISTDVFL